MGRPRTPRESLRIFFFSDWRIQPLHLLTRLLDEAGPIDLILYGGDDVARFGRQPELAPADRDALAGLVAQINARMIDIVTLLARAEAILGPRTADPDPLMLWEWTLDDLLGLFHPRGQDNEFSRLAAYARYGLAGIIGNDCAPHDRAIFDAPGVRDLHGAPIVVDGWGFIGCEGAVDLAGVTRVGRILYPDEAVETHLYEARSQLAVAARSLVIVSHVPPAGCLDTGIRFGLNHLGSPALARFVKAHKPAAVLCGHVHSRGGHDERIGRTLVANAACDDTRMPRAQAALIDLVPGQDARVRWLTVQEKSVTAIPGIGWAKGTRLEAVGLMTPDDVFRADDETLFSAGLYPKEIARLRLSGRATEAGQPVWYAPPLVLPDILLYYDVETGITTQEAWMIGVMREGDDGVRHWIVPDEEEHLRRAMLEDFIAFARAMPGAALCSWSMSNFDKRSIALGIARWAPDLAEDWLGLPQVNLLLELRRCMALPVGLDWSLDSILRWCGYPDDTDPESRRWDGMAIGLAYDHYRLHGTALPLEPIQRKNERDVQGLAHTVRHIRGDSLPVAAVPDCDVPLAAVLLPGSWSRRWEQRSADGPRQHTPDRSELRQGQILEQRSLAHAFPGSLG